MSVVIRVAEAQDVAAIEDLLAGAGVNSDGVAAQIERFLVVEQVQGEKSELVGTVGLELYEKRYGLMRSLVLRTASANAQIGVELIRLLLAYAETTGIAELYLLTPSTAAALFIHMGFSTAAVEQLPDAITKSPHFAAHANEQVIAMVKRLPSTTYPQGHVDNVHK